MFRYAGVAEWQTHLTQNQAVTNRAGSSPAFGTKYHGSTGTSVGPFLMGKSRLIHAVYGICGPFFPGIFHVSVP